MTAQVSEVIFTSLDYLCLFFYNVRAYFYCRSILDAGDLPSRNLVLSLMINLSLLCFVLSVGAPVFLNYILIYALVLLQFFFFFRGQLVPFLFASGTLMFHIMNVKMMVSSLFILLFDIRSYDTFREGVLYRISIFVAFVIILVFLEVFQKVINRETIQLLLRNSSQLRFATNSLMLINVYLVILSLSYSNQAYSPFAAVFLLSTSILLYGAFYTAFLHAIRMSVLIKYREKSQVLEQQLDQSYQSIQALESFAFKDELTEVHNRRFGMEALEKLCTRREPFCACFVDIDHLKLVNDTYGHDEGDRYILSVVRVLSGALGKEDVLCRMGGDEFLLLLPGRILEDAAALLESARDAVLKLPALYHPSMSYGVVAAGPASPPAPAELLREADRQMYSFKQAHR